MEDRLELRNFRSSGKVWKLEMQELDLASVLTCALANARVQFQAGEE